MILPWNWVMPTLRCDTLGLRSICTPTTNTGTWRLGGSSNPRFHHIYGIYSYDVPCCVHVLGDVVHLTSYASTIKQFLPTGATLHGRQTAEFQSPSGRVSCRHTGHQELVWNGMNQWTMSCYVVMLFPAFFFFFGGGGVTEHIIGSAIFECVYLVNKE